MRARYVVGEMSATYDTSTGIFDCPDGTTVQVGADWGDCATLQGLLFPGCASNAGPLPPCGY